MTYTVAANAVRIAAYATPAAAVVHAMALRRSGVDARVIPTSAA